MTCGPDRGASDLLEVFPVKAQPDEGPDRPDDEPSPAREDPLWAPSWSLPSREGLREDRSEPELSTRIERDVLARLGEPYDEDS